MWKKLEPPVPIEPSQVVVGLYVWLDVPWDAHPFLSNRVLVKSDKEVAILRALDISGRLYYYPQKSATSPAAVSRPETGQAPQPAQAPEKEALDRELRELEKAKKDKQRALKEAAARADQAWTQAARETRQALNDMGRSPKQAGKQLQSLAEETASIVFRGQEVLLHLLGDKKDQGAQFHALNTMTLCMLVGKKAGLGEDTLGDLAMAALAHDAGESQVPQQILRNAQRKKHEEDFYRQHVAYGVQFAKESGAFSPAAITMIADHHEALDGSGWPQAKKAGAISAGARILAMVDHYDTLCSPPTQGSVALTPAEALATMFKGKAGRFDMALLSSMIRLLGVYPPGTVVQLSDGALGLVVSPGADSLKPTVLIYTPEVAKQDAPTVDLAKEEDLSIVEAIRPAALPPDVLAWLSPQQRLSYFFSVDEGRR